jgi:ribosomal protein S3
MGLGEKGRRIRELTSSVQKRFKFPVNNRGLCAIAQAESLRYKLLGGLVVRRYVSNLKNCAFIFCTAGSRTWINFKS